MAKKRGGLAGVWDRNKRIIKPVATGLAGLLGTPALGAAVGAAMGGLDRPGKSGVGVDLGGALKGGASGYAAGALGNALPGIAAAGKAGAAGGGGFLGGIGAAGKAALPAITGGGAPGGLPGLGALGSGLGGLLGKAGSALTGNSGMNALAFAQLMNAAQLGKKSGDLADESINTQRDLFAKRAPLRDAGIAGMQAPRTELPQLGKLGAVSNPFARAV